MATSMPWRIQVHASARGPQPTKHYPNGLVVEASAEEVQVWEHVQALETELAEARSALVEGRTPARARR